MSDIHLQGGKHIRKIKYIKGRPVRKIGFGSFIILVSYEVITTDQIENPVIFLTGFSNNVDMLFRVPDRTGLFCQPWCEGWKQGLY